MMVKTAVLQIFVVVFASVLSAQEYTDDPGHKAFVEVDGVRFSVPKKFNVEKMPDEKISFMRRAEYQLAEFVAVPGGTPDKEYLMALSTKVATQMFPKEKPFIWKITPGDLMIKKSKFQIGSGAIKGMNDANGFLVIEYVLLKIKGRDVVAGYATAFGESDATVPHAKWLFDREGSAGASMPGLYALAHIIVSITGEKYKDINPGVTLQGIPE